MLGCLELDVNTFRGDLELAALGNLDGLLGLVAGEGLGQLDPLDDLVALNDLAEDDVLAVEPPNPSSQFPTPMYNVYRTRGGAHEVMMVVMKNWEPLVSLPALAMERRPFLEWRSLKFSSANFSP